MKSAVFALALALALCLAIDAVSTKQKARANEDVTLRGSAFGHKGSDDADDDDAVEMVNGKKNVNSRAGVQEQLDENLQEQSRLKKQVKDLSDEDKSDREIAASVKLVSNETDSPAMGHMLGTMWKDMRMFDTPLYIEHVQEEIHDLKHKEKKLEKKLSKNVDKEEPGSEGKVNYGEEDCRCIGIDELDGETLIALKGDKVSYPADLGARCEAWDAGTHPKCPAGSEGESWCEQKWCYVDPCKCKNVAALPKPSAYLPDAQYKGKPVHFSYATCGGKDSFSAEENKKTAKDIEATCAVKVDAAKWGADNCRCVGIGPQPGTTKVNIKDKQVDFPADVGSTCTAWEADNHPECTGDDAPSWCSQSWCYVDPCACKLEVQPKTSSYVPDANYQGRPVYYSYATCGGKDSYTKGRKEACVNSKTRHACDQLGSKCAWTGKECLGKELVDVCELPVEKPGSKSGAWSQKATLAVALTLLAILH